MYAPMNGLVPDMRRYINFSNNNNTNFESWKEDIRILTSSTKYQGIDGFSVVMTCILKSGKYEILSYPVRFTGINS